jgi:hypothetical protein
MPRLNKFRSIVEILIVLGIKGLCRLSLESGEFCSEIFGLLARHVKMVRKKFDVRGRVRKFRA